MLAFACCLRADALSNDLKDSREVHKLLEKSQRIQQKLNKATLRFAERNHCPTGNSTLDQAGFLVCPAVPVPAPPPEKKK